VAVERHEVSLHGQRLSYLEAGERDGRPTLLLLHGLACGSDTWDGVLPLLAERAHVIAPDLPGSGLSDKPRGDYSLGAHANVVRDLLAVLGTPPVTVVGHSLGGGIALQLCYQHPALCERLALVSSGGLGPEVTGWLRAAALPGSEWLLPLLFNDHLLGAGRWLRGRVGTAPAPAGLDEVGRIYASLADPDTRRAFLHTLRSVVDVDGQRVQALDKLYLADGLPTLIVWGALDRLIPADHGRAAAERLPGSTIEVFERAGHFPQRDEPARFARVVLDFLDSTAPARIDPEALGERLRDLS
jgi:pimeloyl-ACP methyl ester carboxylesterase